MRAFAAALVRAGVSEACISPGSRSTAAALALVHAGVRPWVITDERAAGFFALGMAREARRPVALLCTSGTAAANYFPAVVEAALSEVPLVVLTADRPPELRDCHAAQTIDQVRIFGSHVRWSVDAPAPSADVDLDDYFRTLARRAAAAAVEAPRGPVHVNLPMREPLVDVVDERRLLGLGAVPSTGDDVHVYESSGLPSATAVTRLAGRLAGRARGLVVCGPGAGAEPGAPEAIAALAARLGWPICADPLSGLRFGSHDRTQVVDAYDALLQDGAGDAAWHPEAVLQLGRPVVSASLQRLLAAARAPLHVVVAPPGRWPDPLHAATDVVRAEPTALAAALRTVLPPAPAEAAAWLAAWRRATTAFRAALDRLLAGETELFEGSVLAELVTHAGDDFALHVGNSLPVRALDTFVGGSPIALDVACNRGANGIDGVVSTALGAAALRRRPTVLVVGDLSFLHDLGALQIAARHRVPLLVVVVNNDGGGIFSFLPQAALGDTFEMLFGTPHGLELSGAVTMCGGRHVRVRSRAELGAAIARWRADPSFTVVEVPSDRAATRMLHARLLAAARAPLGDGVRAAEAP
jgi:2-succinyl-5-enolpyruvyl-6-hydroxy-3-cyclohexene-1-carboxylate synthase